jgi:regulator of replication initiation timing
MAVNVQEMMKDYDRLEEENDKLRAENAELRRTLESIRHTMSDSSRDLMQDLSTVKNHLPAGLRLRGHDE